MSLNVVSAPRTALEWHEHYKAVRTRMQPPKVAAPSIAPPALPLERDILDVSTQGHSPAVEVALMPPPYLFASKAKKIAKEVTDQFGFSFAELASPQRAAALVRARQHLMWRLKKETSWSLPQIGRFVGGRDHTTVLHAVRKVERMLAAQEAAE